MSEWKYECGTFKICLTLQSNFLGVKLKLLGAGSWKLEVGDRGFVVPVDDHKGNFRSGSAGARCERTQNLSQKQKIQVKKEISFQAGKLVMPWIQFSGKCIAAAADNRIFSAVCLKEHFLRATCNLVGWLVGWLVFLSRSFQLQYLGQNLKLEKWSIGL